MLLWVLFCYVSSLGFACILLQCCALQVCEAVHKPAVAVRQLLAMLDAGVDAGPGGVAGLFKLLDSEGVRMLYPAFYGA